MSDILKRFDKLKSKKEVWIEDKKFKEIKLKSKQKKCEDLIKAKWVLSEVIELTQNKFKDKVEKLITMVLQSVFQKKMEFELKLEKKRGVLFVTPWIKENGNRYNPKDTKGGSLKQLISFAFKMVLWSMEKPRSRNVFCMDEPFGAVGKGPMLKKVGKMMKELSDRLKLQFVLVSHEREMANIADNIIRVNQKNGISFIEEN